MNDKKCRFCDSQLDKTFVNLGMSPLSNSYLTLEVLNKMEKFYPLHTFVCEKCFLVQLDEFESPEQIFSDYAYFSSFSDSWLKHCRDYANMMIENFKLSNISQVIELASNDGYLLQYFKEKGIPVIGIEPAANVAKVAVEKGIPSIIDFFGQKLAIKLTSSDIKADLIIGNNVLAHVPNINDFVKGMRILLKSNGIITMEFPHLKNIILLNQFDTIYHEHFSYLSLTTVIKIFEKHNLKIFNVDQIPTHGGSLRIYATGSENNDKFVNESVGKVLMDEEKAGLKDINTYSQYSEQVKSTKREILEFLIKRKQEGKTIVGYGAPAKGNTLLNYCGIRTDFIDYTVDISPHKQGLYLPGTHIPIELPENIRETKPDYVFILPWNLKDEIMEQLSYIRSWGGKFIVPIPKLEVI